MKKKLLIEIDSETLEVFSYDIVICKDCEWNTEEGCPFYYPRKNLRKLREDDFCSMGRLGW